MSVHIVGSGSSLSLNWILEHCNRNISVNSEMILQVVRMLTQSWTFAASTNSHDPFFHDAHKGALNQKASNEGLGQPTHQAIVTDLPKQWLLKNISINRECPDQTAHAQSDQGLHCSNIAQRPFSFVVHHVLTVIGRLFHPSMRFSLSAVNQRHHPSIS